MVLTVTKRIVKLTMVRVRMEVVVLLLLEQLGLHVLVSMVILVPHAIRLHVPPIHAGWEVRVLPTQPVVSPLVVVMLVIMVVFATLRCVNNSLRIAKMEPIVLRHWVNL
jgi:hypothetical protein